MEYQAIVDLVGDKIREIFNSQNVSIGRYDLSTDQVDYSYVIQKGQRVRYDPLPFSGVHNYLISTHQPLVVNENAKQKMLELGSNWSMASSIPLSLLYVPLMVGETTTGVISIYDFDHENAFGESDVHLMQTLASSMSIALENARLFDETQLLLKETEQRNNELAILNCVSDAMVKTLDVMTMTHLVGDTLRDIFQAESVLIMLLDRQTNLIHVPYEFDKNEGGYIDYVEPFP